MAENRGTLNILLIRPFLFSCALYQFVSLSVFFGAVQRSYLSVQYLVVNVHNGWVYELHVFIFHNSAQIESSPGYLCDKCAVLKDIGINMPHMFDDAQSPQVHQGAQIKTKCVATSFIQASTWKSLKDISIFVPITLVSFKILILRAMYVISCRSGSLIFL